MSQLIAQQFGGFLQFCRARISRLWWIEARFKGARLGRSVRFWGRPILSVAPESRLEIQDGVVVASSPRSTALGCFQPSVLRTLAPGAELVIESRVGLSAAVLCAGLSIRVGEGTLLGAGAMVVDNDFHARAGQLEWRDEFRANARPVRIGRGAFIGARAIVLKGVTIGDGAQVGAGAVVTDDVPPFHIAVGNPARILPP